MIGNSRTSTMDDFVRLPNHSTVNWFRNRIRRPSYMPRFGYIAVYGDGTSGFGNRIRRRKQSLKKKTNKQTKKKRLTIFDPFSNLRTAFSLFTYTEGLLLRNSQKLNCFDIRCAVQASRFSLNQKINTTLQGPQKQYKSHLVLCQK